MRSKRYVLKKIYAELSLNWCINNLGIRHRKKREIILKFSDKKGFLKVDYYSKKKFTRKYPIHGKYCEFRNMIIIHEPNCKTIYDVVSTVIHEYTHYLQSMYQYRKYEEIYYYSENPLEKEAKKNETLFTVKCIDEIKSYLKTR